jgi:hypothetical protein
MSIYVYLVTDQNQEQVKSACTCVGVLHGFGLSLQIL